MLRDANQNFSTKSMNLTSLNDSRINLLGLEFLRCLADPQPTSPPPMGPPSGSLYFGPGAGIFAHISTNYAETALGANALKSSIGNSNTALGAHALILSSNTQNNTGVGAHVLERFRTGIGNAALGYRAGHGLEEGSNNIYIGAHVGDANVIFTENNTIKIGLLQPFSTIPAHAACFIGGIYGKHVSLPFNRKLVYIDPNGKLGTEPSVPLFDSNNAIPLEPNPALMQLQPVTSTTNNEKHFGLIPAQVETLMPDLVTYTDDHKPADINYQALSVLQLGMLQMLHQKINKQEATLRHFKTLIEKQEAVLEGLKAQQNKKKQ